MNSKTGVVTGATPVSGATGSTYTVPTTGTADSGFYYCVVEFFNERVTGEDTVYKMSAAVSVDVIPAPIADMSVLVTLKTNDGQRVQYVQAVKATDAVNGWVTLTPDLSKLTEGSDYDDTNVSQMVYFVAGSTNNSVEFTVNRVKFAVTADTDYVTGGKADVQVDSPAGHVGNDDTVVIKFTPKDTGWSDGNKTGFKAKINDGTPTSVSATYHTDNGTYFLVSVPVTGVSDDFTITVSWSAS